MPYASHRLVGVIELDPADCPGDSSHLQPQPTPAAPVNAAVIRKIGRDIADSRSSVRLAFEPALDIDDLAVRRQLESELEEFLAANVSVAVN